MSGDPTRIDIEFDPLTHHMRGVSMHGRIPFDVPLMSEVASNLWVGGCQDLMILPSFIKHLVSLYPWEAYTVKHDLDTALEVTMYDSEERRSTRWTRSRPGSTNAGPPGQFWCTARQD